MSNNSIQTLCPNKDTMKNIFKSIKLKASMMSLSKTNWLLISDHKIPKPPKRAVSTTHQTCNGHVSNLNIIQLNVCNIRIQLWNIDFDSLIKHCDIYYCAMKQKPMTNVLDLPNDYDFVLRVCKSFGALEFTPIFLWRRTCYTIFSVVFHRPLLIFSDRSCGHSIIRPSNNGF